MGSRWTLDGLFERFVVDAPSGWKMVCSRAKKRMTLKCAKLVAFGRFVLFFFPHAQTVSKNSYDVKLL